ncbi:DUF2799 domain-containing protein [Algicella marina]|uniref:DUF2799 domain-containing protein n=1 Tax=Algicella marina TaxID=2683284 RepID=A0A6P1T327_9RHOB|nr:DUF2799 domain-containing protein [Algicella marina]QHQ36120.1 DUF2799 domain-containing protein [Algicella marina]
MRWLLIVAALMALSSCATLTEEQCEAGNWAAIGYRDGENGRLPNFLEQHRKACAEVGITPAQSEWEAGRTQGLTQYCRPSRAYRVGRSGRALSPVCTDAQWQEMRPAWNHGRNYWRLEDDINDIEREERRIRSHLAALTKGDESLRAHLLSDLRFLRLRRQQLELRQLRYSSWP